ncbi:MAG: hypothetical protein AB1489_02845 [Acidobacteriota bacterium]
MEQDVFDAICAHLEPGQLVSVKMSTGNILTGTFVRYERAPIADGILVMSTPQQTLGLSATQIVRILPYTDSSFEDTIQPIDE